MSDSITFLGTSDGLPSPDRHYASLLLRLAGQTVLLDCGEPCSHTLKRMAVDFNSLDAIFVTHTHSDHVGGLPMLVQSLWLEQRIRPLPLWMPRHAIAPLQHWLHTCYLYEPQIHFRLQWKPLSARSAPRIGSVRIRARRTTHLDAVRNIFAKDHPQIGFDAFSLLLEGSGKRVVYSGDIGSPLDLVPLLKRPVDVLVVEMAHCNPDQMLDLLRLHEIRHIVFTHLSRQLRRNLGALRAKAAKTLRPRKVTLAADGDVIRF